MTTATETSPAPAFVRRLVAIPERIRALKINLADRERHLARAEEALKRAQDALFARPEVTASNAEARKGQVAQLQAGDSEVARLRGAAFDAQMTLDEAHAILEALEVELKVGLRLVDLTVAELGYLGQLATTGVTHDPALRYLDEALARIDTAANPAPGPVEDMRPDMLPF